MDVRLDFSREDARFLVGHLTRYIATLDDELVHSDKRAIQHELATEVERLRGIRDQISAALS